MEKEKGLKPTPKNDLVLIAAYLTNRKIPFTIILDCENPEEVKKELAEKFGK